MLKFSIMQCSRMVFCRPIHIHDFVSLLCLSFCLPLEIQLAGPGKRSVASFFRKVCPVAFEPLEFCFLWPITPSYSSCLNSLHCRLLCKMQINGGTILLGPENVSCYQRSGSGMRPKCTHTNISQNIGVCLSPVCVSFIHKEMLMKTVGPFQPQRWQSEPR